MRNGVCPVSKPTRSEPMVLSGASKPVRQTGHWVGSRGEERSLRGPKKTNTMDAVRYSSLSGPTVAGALV